MAESTIAGERGSEAATVEACCSLDSWPEEPAALQSANEWGKLASGHVIDSGGRGDGGETGCLVSTESRTESSAEMICFSVHPFNRALQYL